MASETSSSFAWGILGLVVGAGGMYVLAKEDVWKPNPVEGSVTVLGTTGDVNALEYGGGVVYEDEYGHHWEWWDEPPDNDHPEGHTFHVYRAPIPKDVLKYHNWINESDLEDLAQSADWEDSDAIREWSSSNDVMERQAVLEDIVRYWGAENLDSYPIEMTYEELSQRWPMFA